MRAGVGGCSGDGAFVEACDDALARGKWAGSLCWERGFIGGPGDGVEAG